MPKKLSLKYKMIFGGIAAVLIPFSIAGIIIYVNLSNSLMEMAEEKSLHVATDISQLIDTTFTQEIRLISSIASDPDILDASKTGDYSVAQKELEAVHNSIGSNDFTLFLADREGIARADAVFPHQIGLNLSDREYFQKARNGLACVAGPFFPRGTATPGKPVILASVPILEGDVFYGIAALVFSTDFLVEMISREKLGHTGYAFLLNREGVVLVHPRKNFILKLRLLEQPGTEAIGKIIKSGKDGTVSYVFEGIEKIAGITRVRLTGWTVAFTQSRDEIMRPLNQLLFSVLISGILFLIAAIAIIAVFFTRISNPIQKIMEMMRQVTRHATEVIIQIGLDRKIVYANPVFEKITGLKARDIIGTRPEFDTPDQLPAETIWNFLESGTPWSGHIELKGKNGKDVFTLDVMIVPLRGENGLIQGYLEIGRDVTEELMFEKRLHQAQKLEAIGTMAGGIAHDFNNILSGIFGYAELALIKRTDAGQVEAHLRQIIIASERARDLVSQILTFSRQSDIKLSPLQPESVIKEALKLLQASTPSPIHIESEINSRSAIMAEPTQIHQVIMNLVTNAVHAIGDNPGTIKLELEDFIVDKEFTKTHPNIKHGKHILLRISDTGSGMVPETLEHIFEPFYSTKTHGKGTGLGLSVVHGIVKKLNGIITAYSEIGKGTVFNIIIPCIQANGVKLDPQASSIKKGTERIAIIDDEIDIAATLQAILINLGYKVTAFTDSMEALTEIQNRPGDFDIIVSDYSMPQVTGLEIAEQLKKNGIKLPMILTSGYMVESMKIYAQNAGVSELMTKPVNTYQLTDAIHRVLREQKPST